MVLVKNRYEEQWNRREGPDMNPHSYHPPFIIDKCAKNI
jgi:hypothetical protein